jgi:hypothetical protein
LREIAEIDIGDGQTGDLANLISVKGRKGGLAGGWSDGVVLGPSERRK